MELGRAHIHAVTAVVVRMLGAVALVQHGVVVAVIDDQHATRAQSPEHRVQGIAALFVVEQVGKGVTEAHECIVLFPCPESRPGSASQLPGNRQRLRHAPWRSRAP